MYFLFAIFHHDVENVAVFCYKLSEQAPCTCSAVYIAVPRFCMKISFKQDYCWLNMPFLSTLLILQIFTFWAVKVTVVAVIIRYGNWCLIIIHIFPKSAAAWTLVAQGVASFKYCKGRLTEKAVFSCCVLRVQEVKSDRNVCSAAVCWCHIPPLTLTRRV